MKLSQKQIFEKYTNLKLDKCIYNFGITQVFTVQNKSQVVKIVNMKEYRVSDKRCHAYIAKLFKIMKDFQHKRNSPIVKIYKYGKFKHENNIYYFYLMDKLKPITPLYVECDQIASEIEKSLKWKVVLTDIPLSAKTLVRQLLKYKLSYQDFHGENIMKNKHGAYQVIDLESFLPYPYERN